MPHDREIVLPCGRFLKLLLALPITRSMAATCASRSTVLLTFDSIVQPLSVLLRSDVKLRSSPILHTASGWIPSSLVMWSGSQENPVITKRTEISSAIIVCALSVLLSNDIEPLIIGKYLSGLCKLDSVIVLKAGF